MPPRDGYIRVFINNLVAYPGIVQRLDDKGCYYWLRINSLLWSGIVIGFMMFAVFLPVRLLFYTYISSNWLGNLGMMSLIAGIILLVVHYSKGKKNIAGKFSLFYRQRMSRLVHNEYSIPIFICFQVFSMATYVTLFYVSSEPISFDSTPDINEFEMKIAYVIPPPIINTNNNVFDKIKDIDINNIALDNMLVSTLSYGVYSQETKEKMYDYFKNSRHTNKEYEFENLFLSLLDFLVSIPKNMNMFTVGWFSHFVAVWFVGDVEYTILFFAFRKAYKKIDMGLPFKAIDAWKSNRGGFLVPDIKELKRNANVKI